MPRSILLALVAAAVPVAGCGQSGMHPVSGRVVYPDGTPLTAGKVVIDTGNALTGSWGSIRPDGTFVMGTNTPDDGVPPGTHRVYIHGAFEPPADPNNPPPNPKALVHARFTNPAESGLTFTVPEQVKWEIVVEHPPRRK
jgi:hypothetical protein